MISPGPSTLGTTQPAASSAGDEDNKTVPRKPPISSRNAKIPAHRLASIKAQGSLKPMLTRPPVHVGGTPGTGKSAFSLYLLHILLEKYPNDAFVYRHGDVNPGCFVHYRGRTYCHPSVVHAFSDGLWLKLFTANFSRPIWTILDGAAAIPTGTPEANLVVLTSPGQQTISLKHFLKYATTIVNPPWTLEDIESVRDDAFPHLTADSVRNAYAKWGGVPRILLDWADKPQMANHLEASIYTAEPFALFRQACLAQIDHANVSGLHFHLIPGEKVPADVVDIEETEFQFPAYCWASTWLQGRFWEALKNGVGETTIMQFLLDRNNISTARAYAFEPHIFRTVENAGMHGRLKRFTVNGPQELTPQKLDPLTRKTFYDFKDLPTEENAHKGHFYIPLQTNHTSLDFYVPDFGLLIQVTVGQKHGIKWSGLQAAITCGMFDEWKNNNPGEKLRLVFLCDKYSYNQFTKQPYINSQGTVYKQGSIISKIDNLVDQYAWEFDVENQIKLYLRKDKEAKARPLPSGSWGTANELNLVEKKTGKGKGKELEETQMGNESVGPSDTAGAGAVEIDSLAGRMSRKRSANQAGLS